MSTEVSTIPDGTVQSVMNVTEIAKQVACIQDAMKHVMKDTVHYGLIPNCGKKPSLLQPGAQILSVMFQLYARVKERKETAIEHDSVSGHINVRYHVEVVSRKSGQVVAEGVGSCSTMETKYRYRGTSATPLPDKIPADYQQNKAAYRQKGFVVKKINDVWTWCKASAEKLEFGNPADYYNTVDKMAFKRAFVHGIINATACSDLFTQDLEDMVHLVKSENVSDSFVEASKPQDKPQPTSEPEVAPAKPETQQETVAPEDLPLTDDEQQKIIAAFSVWPAYTQEHLEKIVGLPRAEWNRATRRTLLAHHKAIKARH